MKIRFEKKKLDLGVLNGESLFDIVNKDIFIESLKNRILKIKNDHWEYLNQKWLKNNIKRKGLFSSKTGVNMIYDSSLYQNSEMIYFGFGHKWMLSILTDKGIIFSKCKVPSNKLELIEEIEWQNLLLKVNPNSDFITIDFEEPSLIKNSIWDGMKYFYEEVFKCISNEIKSSNHIKNLIQKHDSKIKSTFQDFKKRRLIELDKDNNGKIDLIEAENTFELLLQKNKNEITKKTLEGNQNYIHDLVKLSNYLDVKKKNLQTIFNIVKKSNKDREFKNYINTLSLEIKSYNLLVFNSLNLIISLLENDLFTFYNIYQKLDKLNIFNSNWENQVTQKLNSINKSIDNLMFEIREMSISINESISDLSYVTEKTGLSLEKRLSEVNSSIQTNNLLTLINTYQTYKVNKNTRSLRG